MKKSGFIFGVILSIILVSGLVLAAELPAPTANIGELPAPQDLSSAFAPLVDLVRFLFNAVAQLLNELTGGSSVGQFVFGKFIIFLILVYILAGPSTSLVGGSETSGWVVSVLVSMLGVYFLPDGVIRLIIVPYNALAVTITLMAVLILGYLTFKKYTKTFRKIAWSILTFSIFGLYLYNAITYDLEPSIRIAYLVAAGFAISMIFWDSKFSGFFNKMKLEEDNKIRYYERYLQLQGELEAVNARIIDAIRMGHEDMVPALEKSKARLEKALSKIDKSI